MRGRPPKPPDELVFRRGGRVKPPLVVSAPSSAPPAPAGLGEYAEGVWAAFWSSPVAGAVDRGADSVALWWWIHCVDERERLRAALAEALLAPPGPTAAATAAANRRAALMGAWLREVERAIARAEEHFGMTPLSRRRMGITVAAPPAPARQRVVYVVPREGGDASG
jgi:hypothetical protein